MPFHILAVFLMGTGPVGKRWKWGQGKRTSSRVATDRGHNANLAIGRCRCGNEPPAGRKTCKVCVGRTKKLHAKKRAEIIQAYGGKCACCGEAEPLFLTLDHVDGRGAAHRIVEPNSTNLTDWAYRNNFPPVLQLLCYNCNWGKAKNGNVCPHQKVA